MNKWCPETEHAVRFLNMSTRLHFPLKLLLNIKEYGGECAILIHNMVLYTPTKDETDRLKIKENIQYFDSCVRNLIK